MTREIISFLRERRLKNNWGLRAFCLDNDLSPQVWSRAERGLVLFEEDLIYKVSKALSLSTEEIQILKDWVPLKDKLESYLPAFPHRDFPYKEYIDNLKTTID